MLEILLIISLTKTLAKKAESRGLAKGWSALLPALWIFGEITGFIIGAAMDMEMGAYAIALLGAAAGAGAAFLIVSRMGYPAGEPLAQPWAPAPVPVGQYDPNNPYSPPGTYGQPPRS